MSQQTDHVIKSFAAATALEAYRRVKLTDAFTVGYAGAGESCIGVTQEAAALGAQVPVKMVGGGGGTFKVTCSDAVALSSGQKALYGTANGKVNSSANGVSQFNALETAGADGGIVEALYVNAPGASVVASRVVTVPLQDVKLVTLLQLAATAGSTVFGLAAGTHGTHAPTLVGNAASGNVKTDQGRFMFALPSSYKAGTNLTLRVHGKVTVAATVSCTLDALVYESDKEGAAGGTPTDLCATAAIALTDVYGDKDFTITGTNLVAGDVLDILLTAVNTDTGGTSGGVVTLGDIRILLSETVVP